MLNVLHLISHTPLSFMLCQGLRKDRITPHLQLRAVFEQLWGDENTPGPTDFSWNSKKTKLRLKSDVLYKFSIPIGIWVRVNLSSQGRTTVLADKPSSLIKTFRGIWKTFIYENKTCSFDLRLFHEMYKRQTLISYEQVAMMEVFQWVMYLQF